MNFDDLLNNTTFLAAQLGVNRGLRRRDLMRLLRIIQRRRRVEVDEMIGAAMEARLKAQLRKLKSTAMNPPASCARPEAPTERASE